MAITLYTIQIARWRVAEKLGIHLLDSTAKSGLVHFAPDFKRVMDYKNGTLSQADYTTLYLSRMRNSFRNYRERWEELKGYESLAIGCYCPAGQFCHRHLLLDMFVKYLEAEGFTVVLGGELLTA